MNIINHIKSFDASLEIRNQVDIEIHNLGTLKEDDKGTLSYLYDLKYESSLVNNEGINACFVTNEVYESVISKKVDCTYIISEDPTCDFFLFHNHLINHTAFYGDKVLSIIPSSAIIDPGVHIAPHNVVIGENVHIGCNAVIMEGTKISDNVEIGPNATIGIDGTQISKDKDGTKYRVKHAGGVIIGNGTFVGANAVIQKSLFKNKTMIGNDCSISPLVIISHNVKIRNNVMILANSTVCGSVIIDDNVRVSPGSVISNSLVLQDDSFVTLGSIVTTDVAKGERVSGNFAIPHHKFLKHVKEIS